MARPTITVDIALTTNPTEAPSWMNVTSAVLAITIRRGRSFELDEVSAGECRILLDNRDRRFDPFYVGGPYYGFLRPMRRVRVRATWLGQTSDLFTGYITAWPQRWPGGLQASVELRAVDGFHALALKRIEAQYPAEKVSDRIKRVLDAASWTTGQSWVLGSAANSQLGTTTILGPVGDRQIDDSVSTIQATTLHQESALEHLQRCREVEDGLLFVNGRGAVVFRHRHARIANPTLVTLGDGGGDELPYRDIVLSYDDERIWNDVSVKRSGSNQTWQAQDVTSQARYFPRSYTLHELPLDHQDGATAAESEARARASWLVRRYAEPALRATSLVLEGAADDRLWPHVIGRELGDRITVKRRPQGGTAIVLDCHIEGIAHDITKDRWETTWSLSPADPTTYWRLGDVGSSRLGQTTILAY